jgi:hypothetical protein
MVPFICFGCGQTLQVEEALAGTMLRCPQCNHLGAVPTPAGAPARAEQAPRPDLPGKLARLWQQGKQPDVRAYLRNTGRRSLAETVAVLRVDQRACWFSGRPVLAESYLTWYPEVAGDLESALELIYGEYLLREGGDKPPELTEYLGRFPRYATRLRQQIELHQALGDLDGPESSLSSDWMILADDPSNDPPLRVNRRWVRRTLLVAGPLLIAAILAFVAWNRWLVR